MALAMHSTLTVSCDSSNEQRGPTLVHSTGVESYRIQPEIIRILQQSCTNEKLSDDEKGVQCADPPAHILQVFKNAGFTVTAETTSGGRKLWILTKTSEGGTANDDEGADDQEEEEEEEE
ncbi:unnamed protein product [Didymodactylos carnosus]|uniref:Uncharacterized protein n=1 Tax=Didymodactylos carnosus TaxID=1234261 RepID=A0A8S2FG12_9BILA|nr:unnamed protein product [Didymodactylos carnosus]CAF4251702.1 unnamed protein product [Didymodactylos carnosus]